MLCSSVAVAIGFAIYLPGKLASASPEAAHTSRRVTGIGQSAETFDPPGCCPSACISQGRTREGRSQTRQGAAGTMRGGLYLLLPQCWHT
jgi:hypothetical protein